MNNDDYQTGRILSRREMLTWLGAAGVAVLAGYAQRRAGAASAIAAPSSCLVSPAQTEGPYFVDTRLNRSDIRSDPSDGSVREGLSFTLNLAVWSVGASGCAPLTGAMVDIWHCDALGVYSGASDPGFNTSGKKFLRGYQLTDASGHVAFTTIYPDGYDGRAVHIHFKVRGSSPSGRGYEFTSQFYFDDATTDRVHARQPYAARKRALRNAADYSYRNGGNQLLLALTEGRGGYTASFDIGLKSQ